GSDPDIYELWHSTQKDKGGNYAGLDDKGLDGLILSARQTPNTTKRKDLYNDALHKWIDLAPSIILYQPFYEQILSDEISAAKEDLKPNGADATVLYSPEDRFRHLTTWGIATTRQIRPDLRNQSAQPVR